MVRLVITSVGLCTKNKRLSFTLGDNAPVVLPVNQVFQREIVEFQAQLTHQSGNTPSGRKFNLVVSFGGQRVGKVYSAVFWIWIYARLQVFGVEMSGLSYLTYRADKVLFAENGSRFST
ncbi:hypothetical protein SDC9_72438 [bioreactor metagenome]|uniref:Uncharacterized protein n=1 Tax=bioreactor metagenome TaxID=1076179 RepID=A0A644YCL2_9ZZZZ